MNISRKKFDIARAKAQITVTDLCKSARCSPTSLKGKSETFPLSVLCAGRVAAVLGVDLEYLLEDENPERLVNENQNN